MLPAAGCSSQPPQLLLDKVQTHFGTKIIVSLTFNGIQRSYLVTESDSSHGINQTNWWKKNPQGITGNAV